MTDDKKQPNVRQQCLIEADKCVNGDRDQDYGSPLTAFNVIATMWGAYLGTAITPKQVADMMILMKVARNKNKSKADNYVDIVGYGACGYEIFKTAEKQK